MNASGATVWLDDGGLAYFPNGDLEEARVYDRSLRLRSRIRPWRARAGAVAAGSAYGIGWQGELTRAAFPRGPVHRLRVLPSPVVRSLVPVPGR